MGTPFNDAVSPVDARSPSYATNPTVASTGPDTGAVNPLTAHGIENIVDIIADFEQAIAASQARYAIERGWMQETN